MEGGGEDGEEDGGRKGEGRLVGEGRSGGERERDRE